MKVGEEERNRGKGTNIVTMIQREIISKVHSEWSNVL